MCLIVSKPAKAVFTEENIRCTHDNNPHGFGIMAAIGGKVVFERTMGGVEEQLALIKKYDGLDIAMHWRFTTHGAKAVEMCHPFQVLSKEKDGRDLFMMHNGVINSVQGADKTKSDTWYFVEDYLRPILRKKPSLVMDSSFQDMVEMAIGWGSKLLFLDDLNRTVIINQGAGEIDKKTGMWLSNTYSLKPTHRRATTGYAGPYAAAGWEESDDFYLPGRVDPNLATGTGASGDTSRLPFQGTGTTSAAANSGSASSGSGSGHEEDDEDDSKPTRTSQELAARLAEEDGFDEDEAISTDITATAIRGMSETEVGQLCWEDPDSVIAWLKNRAWEDTTVLDRIIEEFVMSGSKEVPNVVKDIAEELEHENEICSA